MAVDCAIVDIDVLVIGHIEQLVARFHHTGTLGERLEDQEFGHREAHVRAVPPDFVPSRVHQQPTALERRRVGLVGACDGFAALQLLPAQDRTNARDQKPLREGFGDVVIRAHGKAERFVDLIVLGGEEDHRH